MSFYTKTYEIRDNKPSQDFLISHYKSQILQKTRGAGNFGELQLKFRNLQSDINQKSNELYIKLQQKNFTSPPNFINSISFSDNELISFLNLSISRLL